MTTPATAPEAASETATETATEASPETLPPLSAEIDADTDADTDADMDPMLQDSGDPKLDVPLPEWLPEWRPLASFDTNLNIIEPFDEPDANHDELLVDQEIEPRLQPPDKEVYYRSVETLYHAVKRHAFEQGYAVTVQRSKSAKGKVIKIWLQCDRSAKPKQRVSHTNYKRFYHGSRAQQCPFRCVSTHSASGYSIRVKELSHNYDPLNVGAMPSARRQMLTPRIYRLVEAQTKAGLKPRQIINSLLLEDPNICIIEQDIYNIKHAIRTRNLNGRSPLQALFEQLADGENCYWDCFVNEDQKLIGLFFSPLEYQTILEQYSEVLIVDYTYRTNHFNIPLFDILGVDSLQHTFYAGFCFLSQEKEEDYIWALDCLYDMYARSNWPMLKTIITDKDPALAAALATVSH